MNAIHSRAESPRQSLKGQLIIILSKCCCCNLACFGTQTGESWQRAVECKSEGALHLDEACQGLPHLQHFVMFSSMVAWAGNEGTLLLAQLESK